MKDSKRELDKLIEITKQDQEILAVFLFGSAGRGDNYKESDLDICLLMKPDSHSFLKLSQKRLKYLKLFNMDIQIFQQLPLYIRIRIIKEAKILFCTDEDELYQIAFNTIREFSDFEHIYRYYLKEVADAG